MTKTRKLKLEKIVIQLETLLIELDSIRTEEREQYDKLSQVSQQSERGQALDHSASTIEESYDNIEQCMQELGYLTQD